MTVSNFLIPPKLLNTWDATLAAAGLTKGEQN